MKSKLMRGLVSYVIGPKLRYLRKRANMSKTEYAALLDITPTYLHLVETGSKLPSHKVVGKAASFHELEPKDLYCAPTCIASIEYIAQQHGLDTVRLALEILEQKDASDASTNDTRTDSTAS